MACQHALSEAPSQGDSAAAKTHFFDGGGASFSSLIGHCCAHCCCACCSCWRTCSSSRGCATIACCGHSAVERVVDAVDEYDDDARELLASDVIASDDELSFATAAAAAASHAPPITSIPTSSSVSAAAASDASLRSLGTSFSSRTTMLLALSLAELAVSRRREKMASCTADVYDDTLPTSMRSKSNTSNALQHDA